MNLLVYAHWFMSIIISHIKDHSISVDQAIYATSIVATYLDTSTVNTSKTFYNTNFPYDLIFNKADSSTSYEQVEKLTGEFNIHCKACIGSFICLLSTRVYFSFLVHKLARFSSNPGKLYFESLVHILRYIREKNNFGLNHYSYMNDAPVSVLLRQASIKTENQFMGFSNSS